MQLILVVDDYATNRLAITAILEPVGYKILEASSGKEALKIMENVRPDLVITDILMPIMDGFEFVRRMRLMEGVALTPVIFLTATYLEKEAEGLAKQCGALQLLTKPIDTTQLMSIVQEVFSEKLEFLPPVPEAFTQEHIQLISNHLFQKINELKTECEARRKAESMIHKLAYYDPLTGLPNRTMFMEVLRTRISQWKDTYPLAVVILNIKQFKMLVNTLGYQKTDTLFQQINERLQEILKQGDFMARLYNDYFALLLPLKGRQKIDRLASSIKQPLEKPYDLGTMRCRVDINIGIALYPSHGEEAELLSRRAHVALQRAKTMANSYALYTVEHDPHRQEDLSMLSDLEDAIEHDQLSLAFQPKIEMKSNRVTGVEALVRWQHPVHGLVPPSKFIGPAEQTGLIKPLTQWVLNAGLRQSHLLLKAGFMVPIAVNISARNVADPDLPRDIKNLLATWNMDGSDLEFEITETAMMNDFAMARNTLKELRSLCGAISIDDFGTGYSSLGYIKKMPISSIKIDQSFTRDVTKNKDAATLVRSIIGLAHNLSYKVIAEGVEDQATWDFLAKEDCDEAQGYYISRPMMGDALLAWLAGPPWTPNQGKTT